MEEKSKNEEKMKKKKTGRSFAIKHFAKPPNHNECNSQSSQPKLK